MLEDFLTVYKLTAYLIDLTDCDLLNYLMNSSFGMFMFNTDLSMSV